MDFSLPPELVAYLAELDAFVDAEIAPLEAVDDNRRFFDHRREWARTDWENEGRPRADWYALLGEVRRRADRAGHLRFGLPAEFGGRDGSNLWMAVIRDHLANRAMGLHNDLQNEHSIVANYPQVLMFRDFGTAPQKAEFIGGMLDESRRICVALTEPDHGSDATFMETVATPDGDGWRIAGAKMWTTGFHHSTHALVFARTGGRAGDARGITCFIVPTDAPGIRVGDNVWTFNMPSDHPRVAFEGVHAPADAVFGEVGGGLALVQHFVHENRIRQAASSLGAADYCVRESVAYARARKPFGKPLATNQAIQFPLVELATQVEMLRLLIRKTAWEMDRMTHREVGERLSDKVGMCNYWANRLACDAADRAMQVHGGIGYSREKPFEHLYRHHRRYRITEGAEEIQMRKIAAWMFGFAGPNKVRGEG